jgi:thiol-disulfide isomerase/thioredoxin
MLRRIRALAAVLLCGALVVTSLVACTGKDAVDQTGAPPYKFTGATPLGKVIAVADRRRVGSMTGALVGGADYSLAAAHGHVVLINYWATWCTPCRTETPQLDLLYRDLHAGGVDFVGVDTKELSRSASSSFLSDNKISYPIVWDEPGKTVLELGKGIPQTSLPFTVLIDKDQRVAAIYLQTLTPGDLRPVLATLAAES